jgi:hypothetical protein
MEVMFPLRHKLDLHMSYRINSSFPRFYLHNVYKKVKHSHYRPMGPRGSGRSRLPDSGHRYLKVAGCQLYAPAIFTPRSILVLIFKRLSRPRSNGIVGCHGKILRDTTGDRSRLVAKWAQCTRTCYIWRVINQVNESAKGYTRTSLHWTPMIQISIRWNLSNFCANDMFVNTQSGLCP